MRDDQQWIDHASKRGEVWVLTEGLKRRARLVAWNPRRGERRMIGWARVEFGSGSRATVRQVSIEAIEPGQSVSEVDALRAEVARLTAMIEEQEARRG